MSKESLINSRNVELAKIPDLDSESAREAIYRIAADYAPLIDRDFYKNDLPALKNAIFWDVDYLKDSKWGLSITDSYRCLVDAHRTTQIMGGIKETIRTLRAQGKKEIYAIDAGTGTGIFAGYYPRPCQKQILLRNRLCSQR